MHKFAFVFFIFTSIQVTAQGLCPPLEGTFRCRTENPFDLNIRQETQNGAATYILTDPTGTRSIIVDGQPHEMNFRDGKGTYKAHCDGNSVQLEARSPVGEVLVDRYYIERAGLVRVRVNKTTQRASSLSCAPTQGTWRRYQ